MEYKLENVFGVSKDPVLSYVERGEVDGMFLDALKTDKQIIVYGASKQGKTSLVEKHLPYKDNVLVSLTPKFGMIDVYKSMLSALNIELVSATSTVSTVGVEASVAGKFKAIFPIFAAEASSSASIKGEKSKTEERMVIELNLELPNDVARAYSKCGAEKFIILENFHYLDEDVQKQFAFDLRSFQELGIRFIILGVWREKNRLIQFNGDLLDRVFEVPVEPWEERDFLKVVAAGSEKLNIKFSDALIKSLIDNAFDSIGVVQELLKEVCSKAGVKETVMSELAIDDIALL